MRQPPFELHLSGGMENTEFTFRGMPNFEGGSLKPDKEVLKILEGLSKQ